MPRVLLLCEYPTLNGGEYSLLAVLPHLQQAGFTFAALAPPEGPLPTALAAAGVTMTPLVTHDISGARLGQAAIREQLAAVSTAIRPDVVHANSLSMGRLAGPVAADLGTPSVSHLRDIIGLSAQAVADLNCNRRMLAVSQATAEHHIAQGADAARMHVVYNGIDIERFAPRPGTGWLRKELGLQADAILVGAIGQLVLRKGHDTLVAAAQILAARFPAAHYVIVGSRFSEKAEAYAHEAALRDAFAHGPLAGRGHFLGVRADVELLLPELTLLVHPARQEPLGRVLLEAGAAGTPIIATNVGGTREIFADGTAMIVPPDDPAALASAIERFLVDERARLRFGATAAVHVRRYFSAAASARSLAAHYLEVIDEAAQDRSWRN